MTRRARWPAALSAAGLLVTVGLVAAEPFLLVTAVVPLVYVLVGALSRVPAGAALAARREVATTETPPGKPINVELTVENVGDRTLADVRVVDGVPDALSVVEGAPRVATALRPGETTTVEYAVVARRGTYDFDAPAARVRPLAAGAAESATLPVDGDAELTAGHAVSGGAIDTGALARAGTHPTEDGGGGTEFHSTREYRPGDAVHRIDWRSYAKTGDLATVEYRAERAARTVIVVDARAVGRAAPAAGYPTGVELAAYAAERLFRALEGDVAASVVAVGLDGDGDGAAGDGDSAAAEGTDGAAADVVRVDADAGTHGRDRVADLFERIHDAGDGGAGGAADAAADGAADRATGDSADGAAATGTAPDDGVAADGGGADGTEGGDPADRDRIAALLARLDPAAQVVIASPLLDDWPISLAAALTARGHPTTVVSPDATGAGSLGRRVLGAERAVRLRSLPAGTLVVDWDPDRPLDAALRTGLSGGRR